MKFLKNNSSLIAFLSGVIFVPFGLLTIILINLHVVGFVYSLVFTITFIIALMFGISLFISLVKDTNVDFFGNEK